MSKKILAVSLLIMFVIAGSYFNLLPKEAGAASVNGIDISGMVDVYYSYNFNTPYSQGNNLFTFTGKDNQFAVNLAEIVFEKGVSSPGDVGFRVDLDFGSAADIVAGATSPDDPAEETYKDIQQAYLSYVVPVGNGLTIDIGKFVTHMGLEVIESIDNWNYTRSYLFGYAIPFYHAGVRGSYPISDDLYITGYIYNGWNNVVESGNRMKTFGLQAGFTPVENLSIVLNWIGPESSTGSYTQKHVYDIIVSYDLDERTGFIVNYDLGSQKDTADKTQNWGGFAIYARHQFNEEYTGAFRYELYDDEDGATGIGTTVQEITLTAERILSENLNGRLELRYDSADKDIFDDETVNSLTDKQSTLILGLVYTF